MKSGAEPISDYVGMRVGAPGFVHHQGRVYPSEVTAIYRTRVDVIFRLRDGSGFVYAPNWIRQGESQIDEYAELAGY